MSSPEPRRQEVPERASARSAPAPAPAETSGGAVVPLGSGVMSGSTLLALQQGSGNRAVGRMLGRPIGGNGATGGRAPLARQAPAAEAAPAAKTGSIGSPDAVAGAQEFKHTFEPVPLGTLLYLYVSIGAKRGGTLSNDATGGKEKVSVSNVVESSKEGIKVGRKVAWEGDLAGWKVKVEKQTGKGPKISIPFLEFDGLVFEVAAAADPKKPIAFKMTYKPKIEIVFPGNVVIQPNGEISIEGGIGPNPAGIAAAVYSPIFLHQAGILIQTGSFGLGAAVGVAAGAGLAAGVAIAGGLYVIGRAGSEGNKQAVANAWGTGYANRLVELLGGGRPTPAGGWQDRLDKAVKAYDMPSAKRQGNPLQDARQAGADAADEEIAPQAANLEEVKKATLERYGVSDLDALRGKLLTEIYRGVRQGGGVAPSATVGVGGGDW